MTTADVTIPGQETPNSVLDLWVGVIVAHLSEEDWQELAHRVRSAYADATGYPEVIAHLKNGGTLIGAVKLYREANRIGLMEALDAVCELNHNAGLPPFGRYNRKGEPR
jgi:hypothetical protein